MIKICRRGAARAFAIGCGVAFFICGGVRSPALAADIDGPGAAIITTISIPSIPPGGNAGSSDVQVNAKTNRVYVSNGASVTVLDGSSDTIIANIPVPAASLPNLLGNTGIYQSCVDDVTNTVYSLSEVGVVTVINGATNTVTGSFAPWPTSTITNVDGIVCNPATGKLYMVLYNAQGNSTVVWDTKTKKVLASLSVSTVAHEWLAVNRKTNRIYAQTLDRGVAVIDGAADKILEWIDVGQLPKPAGCLASNSCVNPGSQLKQLAVNEQTNRIYVGGITDGSLSTIDGATNTVIRTDYFNWFPYSIALDSVKNRIYPVDIAFDNISVVDGVTGQRIGNLNFSPGPFPIGCASGWVQLNANASCVAPWAGGEGIAVNPVTGKIYLTYTGNYTFVANELNSYSYVTVLKPTDLGPVDTTPAQTQKEVFAGKVALAPGSGAIDAVLNARLNTLYIANSGANTVSAFNVASQSVTATIPVGASPRAITIDEASNTLYTFNGDGSASILDGNGAKLVANFPVDTNASGLLGLAPQAIRYSRRSGKLFAINAFNQIDVIDPAARKVVATISDTDASDVAINQQTNTVYVSQYSHGTVWVLDGASSKVMGVIGGVGLPAQPVGCYQGANGPNNCLQMSSGLTKIAVDEALQRLYALGQYDGRIATIDSSANRVVGVSYVNAGDYSLAVDPKTHTIFADNVATPALWVLDGQTGQVGSVVNFNSLFCDTALTSCADQIDLKTVTVNPATGAIYVLDQGDLNAKNLSLLYIVSPAPRP